MCVSHYMAKYRKPHVKKGKRGMKANAFPKRRRPSMMSTPSRSTRSRRSSMSTGSTGWMFSSKSSGSIKSGGTTQCGTGHWKSFGKGPKGSAYMKSAKTLKAIEKTLPPQIQLTDDKFQISCASAVQNYKVVGNIYSPYDLYNFNGGQLQATTRVGTNKVILKDYSMIVAFTNQTNANIKVTLYDIVQRRDINDIGNGTFASPALAWAYETAISTSYASTNTAAVPFDSEIFCQYYKVIGSKDYRLGQGETGEHFVKGKIHKVWNHATDSGQTTLGVPGELSRYLGGYKGLTYWCLAVVQGFPTDNDNSTVTTSLAEVDFVTTTRYSYSQVTTQNHTAVSATNLAAAAGHTFNQGSGADAVIASA